MKFPFVFSVPNALVNTKSGFEISSMQRSLILLPDIERRADGSHFTKSSLKKIVPRCSDREKWWELWQTLLELCLLDVHVFIFPSLSHLRRLRHLKFQVKGKWLKRIWGKHSLPSISVNNQCKILRRLIVSICHSVIRRRPEEKEPLKPMQIFFSSFIFTIFRFEEINNLSNS